MTQFNSVQFSSVAQSCPTLCDLMNCSTPGLPVHHQLLEFTQTHVHWVSDAIQLSHLLSSPSPPAPNLSQHQGLFQWVNSSHEKVTQLYINIYIIFVYSFLFWFIAKYWILLPVLYSRPFCLSILLKNRFLWPCQLLVPAPRILDLHCSIWDLQLQHANSELWLVGSSTLTRGQTQPLCTGSLES